MFTQTSAYDAPMPRKLKVALIREEYVAITGNYQLALILNQLIYWSERTKDFDQFVSEESKRRGSEGQPAVNMPLSHGWFYKPAKQLAEELMTDWSERTIGRYVKSLQTMGFVLSRSNPYYKWDKTSQYRVDLRAVQDALNTRGFVLSGYQDPHGYRIGKMSDRGDILPDQDDILPDRRVENVTAIPEIITEIITETHTHTEQPEKKCVCAPVVNENNSQQQDSQPVTSVTQSTDVLTEIEQRAWDWARNHSFWKGRIPDTDALRKNLLKGKAFCDQFGDAHKPVVAVPVTSPVRTSAEALVAQKSNSEVAIEQCPYCDETGIVSIKTLGQNGALVSGSLPGCNHKPQSIRHLVEDKNAVEISSATFEHRYDFVNEVPAAKTSKPDQHARRKLASLIGGFQSE